MTSYNENLRRTSGAVLFLSLALTTLVAHADSSITGPNPVCLGTTNTFSILSTTTAVGFAWNISSNTPTAAVIGSTNNPSVDVVATNGSVFTLECVVDLGGGSNEMASTNIMATGPPPVINCPTNVSVNCFADVPAPDTNAVTASGPVDVHYLGDAPSTNGCVITILRTYEVITSCSTTSTCSQTITVNNTNPPVFGVLPSRSFECGSAWDFDVPVAADACTGDTNVTITISGGTTNVLCGGSFVA